jgi:hypothetical protein
MVFINSFSQQSNKKLEKEFEKLREKTEELAIDYPDSAMISANNLSKIALKLNNEQATSN